MSDAAAMPEALQKEHPRVVCVVLNWNGWRETIPCVRSLLAQEYGNLQVLVVDNASTDNSVEEITRAFPDLELIQAEANRGFAAGCNLGMRRALCRNAAFAWLLNNDTLLPPDTLCKLVRQAQQSTAIGMVGGVFRAFDDPTLVLAWGGGAVNRRSGYSQHFTEPRKLGSDTFLTFASVLIRRELLLSVGLLDEGFFLYYEDTDLCFRAREQGWKLAIASDTAILHKEGVSRRKQDKASTDRRVTASGLRFLTRHGRPPALARVLFLSLRLARRVSRFQFDGMRAVFQGLSDWRQQRTRNVIDAEITAEKPVA